MSNKNNVTIRGLSEVEELFDRTNKNVHKRGKKLLHELGWFAKRTAQTKITEVGAVDLDELRSGIHFRTKAKNKSIETVVKPSEKADEYAIFVEEGTKPHWAPRDALQGWADRHGIPVFLVQRKIAQDGTEPRYFWRDTIEKVEPEADKRISKFVNELFRE